MDINFTGNAVELIQLALAPVFLLVGIGQMLNVMTGRLARVIDRARWFEELEEQNPERITHRAEREIESLRKRMRFTNWSITFLTGAAVTICIAVILLVVNGLVSVKLDAVILGTFIFSLILLCLLESDFKFVISFCYKLFSELNYPYFILNKCFHRILTV